MADKGTIRVKWVRSGIGFTRRQRQMIRGLGLRRLNKVAERADTPRVRALVAKVPHFVEIVGQKPAPAWAGVAEYKITPPPPPTTQVVTEAPKPQLAEAEKRTIEPGAGLEHEIIVADDASTNGSVE
jgi:large subunit ribosomal protein L30